MTPDPGPGAGNEVPVFDGPHFDALYEERPDPWSAADSWYERRKLALVLAALPREHYPRALEIGCSIGVTTAAVAPRCDDLLALDASAQALRLAQQRVHGLGAVSLLHATVPRELPSGTWDLVLLGEVGYFLAPDDLITLVQALPSRLAPGGDLLAVHWRHDAETLPVGGDTVHDRLRGLPLQQLVRHEEEDFWLEVWRRP